MRFAAALSQHPIPTHAVGEVVGQVLEQLGERPDAAVFHVSAAFAGATEDIAATVRATLAPHALVGSTASGVLGGANEVEAGPAIALAAFSAPGAAAVPVGAVRHDDGWHLAGPVADAPAGSTLVLLADPFSFPLDAIVADLPPVRAGLTVVGAHASAGVGPGANVLVAGSRVLGHGAVGLLLPPDTPARPLVSHGCRPVGEPLVVTRATGSLVEEIAGEPALDRLLALVEAASPADRAMLATSIQLGVALDEAKVDLDPDDFVVHAVLGADRARSAVAIEGEVAVGTTVQFHGRDGSAADDDLRLMLADADGEAALVFAGHGRGRALFGTPDHDAGLLAEHLERGALAGAFTSSAVAPVQGRHFVHHGGLCALLLGGGPRRHADG